MSDPSVSMAEALRATGARRVVTGAAMSRHTSWRIGGQADYLVIVETSESLAATIELASKHGQPWIVLGAGSNILVADAGIEGVVILNRSRGIGLDDETDETAVVADSGAFFARVALYTAKHGYAGLEWGVAIPGTIGAGVVNNAGAHHGDVQRSLIRTEVMDRIGSRRMLGADDLRYAYRESELKRAAGAVVRQTELAVTRAWFRVTRSGGERAMALIDELTRQRTATQPITEASAGSTFKNPTGLSAGALIEQAGLKGLRRGEAEISGKHANFVVNRGRARAADILELMHIAQMKVWEQFGVRLEPEVQLVGRWPNGESLIIPTQASGGASPEAVA